VLAEQYHPYSGDAISVSPLTWSHATFIIVVLEYLAKLRELSPAAAQRASVSTV
jgi:GH15 family glucan-1,4-alpha-glucosidase